MATTASQSSVTWPELDAAYAKFLRLCDETDAAAKAIIARGNLWLWLHPFQARQMEKRMLELRDEMRHARDRYMALAVTA